MILMVNKQRCDRCYKEMVVHIMSRLNQQEICMDCAEKERSHPNYEKALDEERQAIKNGNFNHKMDYY